MVFTDEAIVLFRQDFRETDCVAALYTLQHGRINVRLPGVKRAKGKLKALCEPFVCADYRIYTRANGLMGTVTGGKIRQIFPAIRQNLARQSLAMYFCELVLRMTPMHQPSPEKYRLLLQALTELEYTPAHAAFSPAFTLRLMAAAGFGLEKPVLQIPARFWQKMHEAHFADLIFAEPEELLHLSKCQEVCRRFLQQTFSYPLHTTQPFTLQTQNLTATFGQKHSLAEKQQLVLR